MMRIPFHRVHPSLRTSAHLFLGSEMPIRARISRNPGGTLSLMPVHQLQSSPDQCLLTASSMCWNKSLFLAKFTSSHYVTRARSSSQTTWDQTWRRAIERLKTFHPISSMFSRRQWFRKMPTALLRKIRLHCRGRSPSSPSWTIITFLLKALKKSTSC